jgi:SNF2 family DNA or RNA helicase
MLTIHGEIAGPGDLFLRADGDTQEIAYAAELIKTLTPHFVSGDGGLHCPLSWPAVVQLSYTFGTAWRPGPVLAEWNQREAMVRMLPPATAYVAPGNLTPYTHQVSGAAMIKATGKVLITDDPGTGKTITALLGISERLLDHWAGLGPSPEPVLIVCPASVVDSWVEAIRVWTPHWSVTPYRGPKRQNKLGMFDVYVTSYDVARIDAPTGRRGPLNRLAPQSIVIDECHYIKNPGAERSKAVVRIARDAPVVIPMSGTPITHNTGDLAPTLEAMDAGAWPSGERMRQRYLITVDQGGYTEKVLGIDPHTEPEFRACLEGAMRRVAKADVLDLPEKVYSTRTVTMPNTWRKVYDQFEQDMLAELPGGDELQVMDVFSVLTHLKALACAPADVRVELEEVIDEDPASLTFGELITKRHVHLDLKHPSWKVHALLEVLEERPSQSVLVFAPSKQLIMLAGESAQRAGRRVGYIVGGQTAGQRTAVVNAFQAGELDTVMATTGAGGVGITLTAASTVVFLQRPLSLVDRAHRIGQTAASVEYIDIITANTIDTRIRNILRGHAGQLAELVRDPRIVAELLGGTRHAREENAA